MAKHISCLPLVLMLFCSRALAAFNSSGVDTFPGTQLDVLTWATSVANSGTTFSQSGGLTIHSYGGSPPFPWGGYTTKSALVPVGGSVWAQVRVNNAPASGSVTYASLALDTDPHGVNSFLNNSVHLDLAANYCTSTAFQIVDGGERQTQNGIETSYGPAAVLASSELPFNTTYIYQIERLSSSNVRFSLFTENGLAPDGGINIALVNSGTQGFITTAANMYASLEVVGTDTTYASVAINQPIGLAQKEAYLPEPDALMAIVSLLVLRRSRSRRESRDSVTGTKAIQEKRR